MSRPHDMAGNDAYPDVIAELLDAHARGVVPAVAGLSAAEEREAEALLGVAAWLWEAAHGSPPLYRDRTALALGLIPDPSRALSGDLFTRALMASGVETDALAWRLVDRGWRVTPQDVAAWQDATFSLVPPALVQAIAQEVGVEPSEITFSVVLAVPRASEGS